VRCCARTVGDRSTTGIASSIEVDLKVLALCVVWEQPLVDERFAFAHTHALVTRCSATVSATYEARRVVVAQRLGVTEGLKQRVRLENHVLDVIDGITRARDERNVLHDELGGLGLAGSRLATTATRERQAPVSAFHNISYGTITSSTTTAQYSSPTTSIERREEEVEAYEMMTHWFRRSCFMAR